MPPGLCSKLSLWLIIRMIIFLSLLSKINFSKHDLLFDYPCKLYQIKRTSKKELMSTIFFLCNETGISFVPSPDSTLMSLG